MKGYPEPEDGMKPFSHYPLAFKDPQDNQRRNKGTKRRRDDQQDTAFFTDQGHCRDQKSRGDGKGQAEEKGEGLPVTFGLDDYSLTFF